MGIQAIAGAIIQCVRSHHNSVLPRNNLDGPATSADSVPMPPSCCVTQSLRRQCSCMRMWSSSTTRHARCRRPISASRAMCSRSTAKCARSSRATASCSAHDAASSAMWPRSWARHERSSRRHSHARRRSTRRHSRSAGFAVSDASHPARSPPDPPSPPPPKKPPRRPLPPPARGLVNGLEPASGDRPSSAPRIWLMMLSGENMSALLSVAGIETRGVVDMFVRCEIVFGRERWPICILA